MPNPESDPVGMAAVVAAAQAALREAPAWTLAEALDRCVPILNRLGCAVCFSSEAGPAGDFAVAMLVHGSERVVSRLRVAYPTVPNDRAGVRALGIAQRRALAALLGVIAEEPDEDDPRPAPTSAAPPALPRAPAAAPAPTSAQPKAKAPPSSPIRLPAPASPPGSPLEAVVDVLETKSGKKGPYWRVKMRGKWYSCFDSEVAAALHQGRPARVLVEQRGEFSNITGLMPDDAGDHAYLDDDDIPF